MEHVPVGHPTAHIQEFVAGQPRQPTDGQPKMLLHGLPVCPAHIPSGHQNITSYYPRWHHPVIPCDDLPPHLADVIPVDYLTCSFMSQTGSRECLARGGRGDMNACVHS